MTRAEPKGAPRAAAGPAKDLERGRESFAARAWSVAFGALSRADETMPLGAEDLELTATSAYMLGRDGDYQRLLERAHHVHLDEGNAQRAVRCAFWAGLNLMAHGELGPALGWFGRGQRLLEREEKDSVERGYLLIPELLGHVAEGDCDAAYAVASEAAEIAARFGDDDLLALVVQEQGHALVRQGRAEEGLRLVDEVMVSVTAGELSPIVTGLVYCNTIAFCQSVYELRRAREWTAALTRWCELQPDMVAHTGVCLVHRAEIMELQGAWIDALEEARRAGRRFAEEPSARKAFGNALYLEGELHRLRGELVPAEASYRQASLNGWEPQPGLALLRLAQGNEDAAAAAVRRVAAETSDRLQRARVLPAYVQIMLAAGELEEARAGSQDLREIAEAQENDVLATLSAGVEGEVALAQGDAREALVELRRAAAGWQEIDVPYEAARVRVLIGLACRNLGDEDTATLELEAARAAFADLGASPDIARVDDLLSEDASSREAHGLTARELEVLRLVAAGATNKAIAAELVVSERTVDRHVSNIFTKLRVSSRAAATAFAYENDLI